MVRPMARIRNANPRNKSGAYDRLFGDDELGDLVSKIHSAIISSGTELEAMIGNAVQNIQNLDTFLKQEIMPEGVLLARKRQIKSSKILDFAGPEPDFVVFKRRRGVQACHIIELKDGHVFDTKKASVEHQSIHRFVEQNGRHIPYQIKSHFCAFNQEDRNVIWEGFKKRIALEEAMTGREFCELLEISYDEIVERRRPDGPDNIEFFLAEIIKIEPIRQRLRELLR